MNGVVLIFSPEAPLQVAETGRYVYAESSLLFSFFSSFSRQFPLDTLWTLSGDSIHSSEFNAILTYGVYQYNTLH